MNTWSISGIEHNNFFFASPSDFNDPFDCKNLFTFQGASDSDWRKFLTTFLIHKKPQLTEQERKRDVDEVIKSGEHRSREKLAEQRGKWDEVLENHSRRLGIVCLSESPNNILMWSHYADSHRGFCLEFDADILKKAFYCSRVRYRKQYPTFSEFVNSSLDEIAHTFVLTKSNHWEYEKEVRLVINAQAEAGGELRRVVEYPVEALTGIIFGCNMSDEGKEQIIKAVSSIGANVNLYNCLKSSSSYSVIVTGGYINR